MFNLIFLYKGGMVNQLLLSMGKLPTEVKASGKILVQWLDWKDQAHFLFTMLMPVMWQYVGFYFVILITGLNNISPDLYEAAALDGADGWKRTRYITLPLLRNVLCTCLVLAITGALKVFDLPWVMFGAGMPENMSWLTGTYMYDQTFNKMNVDPEDADNADRDRFVLSKGHTAPALYSVLAQKGVLSFWAITTIYPFIWVILNSFRKKGLIISDSFSLPLGDAFTWDNYLTAWERADFKNAYLNSFLISGTVTIAVVILAGLAAYGLVRYRFPGRGLLYSLIMAGMMFPVFSTIIPVFRMEAVMGLAGTGNRWLSLLAVILPQIAGNLCFAIIILMGFIQSVPIELEESAYLDGCNVFQIYFHIIIPAAKSSFATVAIFAFLWSYNDLFTQSFFLRYPQERAITGLLNEISSQAGVNYGLMAASVVLVVIPVLIVYVCLQKHIIKGLTAGAVKG